MSARKLIFLISLFFFLFFNFYFIVSPMGLFLERITMAG